MEKFLIVRQMHSHVHSILIIEIAKRSFERIEDAFECLNAILYSELFFVKCIRQNVSSFPFSLRPHSSHTTAEWKLVFSYRW